MNYWRLDNYAPEPNTGCWLWLGQIDAEGYGRIKVRGTPQLAHREMLRKHGREIPEGYEVDHLCRVKSCVNPAHLDIVRHGENMQRWMRSATRVGRSFVGAA